MKSILATVIALGLAVSSVFAQSTSAGTINTPPGSVVTVCLPVLLSWIPLSPGPYLVSIEKSDQSATIEQFPATNATQVSWLVNLAPNTQFVLKLADNSGAFSQSGIITVQSNMLTNGTSCVGGSTSISFGNTSPFSAATPTAQSPSGATNTSPLTGNTGNTATTNSGSTAAPGSSAGTTATRSSSTTSQSAGAYRVTGQIATAGIIGAAMVALLA